MRRFLHIALCVCISVSAAFVTAPAAAAEMTWTMRSAQDFKIKLSFYSQEARRSWPGPGARPSFWRSLTSAWRLMANASS